MDKLINHNDISAQPSRNIFKQSVRQCVMMSGSHVTSCHKNIIVPFLIIFYVTCVINMNNSVAKVKPYCQEIKSKFCCKFYSKERSHCQINKKLLSKSEKFMYNVEYEKFMYNVEECEAYTRISGDNICNFIFDVEESEAYFYVGGDYSCNFMYSMFNVEESEAYIYVGGVKSLKDKLFITSYYVNVPYLNVCKEIIFKDCLKVLNLRAKIVDTKDCFMVPRSIVSKEISIRKDCLMVRKAFNREAFLFVYSLVNKVYIFVTLYVIVNLDFIFNFCYQWLQI